jgi:DNA polymerase
MYNPYEDAAEREWRHFDWVPVKDERIVMLRSLRDTCKDCVMCDLGRDFKVVQGTRINPHVFSNMNFSKFMVVGQNPGFNECVQDEPFVGQAGENFNKEIEKHGLSRKDFYITNVVKCHTDDNKPPSKESINRCSLFLGMELNILMPKFIITLGAPSFSHFCPEALYGKALSKMTYSKVAKRKVFAVLHPSPLNLTVESRRDAYRRQIALLCKLIKALNQKEQEHN